MRTAMRAQFRVGTNYNSQNAIGHQLVEIRVRALKNILCKIDHGLISVVDLAQEKSLFIRLLEWFNFPTIPMQEEVLTLCNRLVKHSSVARLFREIGALEFLAQLRSNVEPKLQACIDEVMDDLFKLPDTIVDVPPIAYQSQPLKSSDNKAIPPVTFEEEIVGYFQRSSCSQIQQSRILPQKAVGNDTVKCLKYSTFPWLTLTMTDRHVLSSNESSLKSSNHTLVRNTCELLQDVIMQDFPAEIFLQRPKIVQNLLLLTKLAFGGDGTQYLAMQAVGCLTQLSVYLQRRLNFHRDPSFFSTKQDLVSQHSSVAYSQETRGTHISQNPSLRSTSPRPSVVGRTVQRPRGDGQDGDAVSSSASSSQRFANSGSPLSNHSIVDLELPEMESDDSLELQFQQLTLPQFCVAVLEHAVPMLRTGSQKMVMYVLELLFEVLLLVGDSISEDVWNDDSLLGRELMESLVAILDTLAETLDYHYISITEEQSESDLMHHRMAFISIALFTIRLLQIILPVEKARKILPENLGSVLYLLSLDLSFRFSYHSIHETVTAYLEQVSLESYKIYKRATEMLESMECVCTFLKAAETKGEMNLMELIEFADQALISLPYHQQLQVILRYVEICSEISKSAEAMPILDRESRKIFLKLLSHTLPTIKVETYRCCLNLVKACLGIHNVINPMSSISRGVNFLLHPWVLYEICTFGLMDSTEQVNCAAKEILIILLQSHLVLSTSSWNMLIEALYPVIPILQGFASVEDPLGTCILALSGPCNEDTAGILSCAAKIRASLRLFMSKLHLVRSVAFTHLMPHLVNEEDASDKLPVLQGSILNHVSDLYMLEKSIDLQLDTGKSFFKEDNVCKVYGILISETVDLSLRKSAAEQLAVMAQDAKLHAVLKNQGIVEKIVSFAHESVHRNGKSMQCMVLPCLTILRKLVYLDPTLRHSLAQQSSFLLTLFRVSLALQKDKEILSEVAALLTLLLFDEVARIDSWSDNITAPSPPFSLPVVVTQRMSKKQDWISLWSLADEQNNEDQMPSQLGLAWLIPLWVDRDPEVRFGSLGIGSALTLVENGCIAFAASCQNISGGLWGTVLNILLDQSECSMARKEAASILQNLLMICMPTTLEEAKNYVWQLEKENLNSDVTVLQLTKGQSDSEATQSPHSRNSHVSDPPLEQCAVITLHFSSALCGLLANLLATIPEDTLNAVKQNQLLAAFHGLVNTGLLERCLWELGAPLTRLNHYEDIKAQVLSHLQYLSAFSGLVQHCFVLHPDHVTQDDFLKPLLLNIFTVLCIRCKDYFGCEVTSAIYQAWTDLFMLLNTILRKTAQDTFPAVVTAVAKHWAALIGTISLCIQMSTTRPSLYTVSLQFISLLLTEEGKRQCQIGAINCSINCLALTKLLDGNEGDESSGSQLCESLLKSFEGKSSDDTLRKVAAGALIALLPVSICAQKHALEAGLIDSCIEQMKHTYVQFNLDSLRPGKVIQRKKDDSLTRELKMVMHLLRNCLYHNVECKVAASDAHLVSAIYSLWPWFLMDDKLILAALKLLCVYTANLPASCVSLCCGSGAPLVSHSSQKGIAGNSLVHMIMKQALQKTHNNSAIQQMAFAVLSNLAISHECKGVLQKSNFLHNFLVLPLPKTAGKPLSTLAVLWLKLLLNISFEDEGQQMILKMNGSLELLTAMSQHKHKNNQTTALLVLHNICFSPANKPKVLANDKTMSVFAACLENDNPTVQTIGASALWALLHNYQKAKVTLKNPSMKRRVDEANFSIKKCNLEGSLNLYLLKCLENLAILLNC
ncbi:rotatin [Rhincodon typus]|uniref:rotatin n=1 Tax=Rhincodon typus TaxID=259920 RepID=UPI0020305D7C|nr:rotatin [Rhincodon typus]